MCYRVRLQSQVLRWQVHYIIILDMDCDLIIILDTDHDFNLYLRLKSWIQIMILNLALQAS